MLLNGRSWGGPVHTGRLSFVASAPASPRRGKHEAWTPKPTQLVLRVCGVQGPLGGIALRLAIAAAVLCLSTTGALAHGAVWIATLSGGRVVPAVVVDQKTKAEAISAANLQCITSVSKIASREMSSCALKFVFTNTCVAVTYDQNQFWDIQTGADEDDAKFNWSLVAARTSNMTTARVDILCDGIAAGALPRVQSYFLDTAAAVKSWWHDNVTTFDIIAVSIILSLCAALLFMFRKMREVQRLLTVMAPPLEQPPPSDGLGAWLEPHHELDKTADEIEQVKRTRPSSPPTAEPGDVSAIASASTPKPQADNKRVTGELDTSAVKEAFKNKRQEFEI